MHLSWLLLELGILFLLAGLLNVTDPVAVVAHPKVLGTSKKLRGCFMVPPFATLLVMLFSS